MNPIKLNNRYFLMLLLAISISSLGYVSIESSVDNKPDLTFQQGQTRVAFLERVEHHGKFLVVTSPYETIKTPINYFILDWDILGDDFFFFDPNTGILRGQISTSIKSPEVLISLENVGGRDILEMEVCKNGIFYTVAEREDLRSKETILFFYSFDTKESTRIFFGDDVNPYALEVDCIGAELLFLISDSSFRDYKIVTYQTQSKKLEYVEEIIESFNPWINNKDNELTPIISDGNYYVYYRFDWGSNIYRIPGTGQDRELLMSQTDRIKSFDFANETIYFSSYDHLIAQKLTGERDTVYSVPSQQHFISGKIEVLP